MYDTTFRGGSIARGVGGGWGCAPSQSDILNASQQFLSAYVLLRVYMTRETHERFVCRELLTPMRRPAASSTVQQ